MKKTLCVGLLLLAPIGLGRAADVPNYIMAKSPTATAPFAWSGVYLGIHGGGGFGDAGGVNNSQTVSGGLAGLFGALPGDSNSRPRGFLYGGQAGYRQQFGAWVLGIEGTLSGSSIKANSASASSDPLSASSAASQTAQRLKWLATVEGQVGVALGRFLPYLTGGVAFGRVETEAATQRTSFGLSCLVGCGSDSTGTTKTGWTIGGGIDAMLGDGWFIGPRYNYVSLGDVNRTYPGTGTTLGPGTTASSNVYSSTHHFHVAKITAGKRF